MNTLDAYAFARLVAGQEPGVGPDTVSPGCRPLVDLLTSLPPEGRRHVFEGFALGQPDPAAIIQRVAAIDPTGPPPAPEPRPVSAHLGDLAAASAASRFAWPSWIVRGHFNLLSSDPKVGKTHLMLEIARRLWDGEDWPDGQTASYPAGTQTLWVCGDRHQDELRERAVEFGLPPEAVRLNAPAHDAYKGWDLDEPENVAMLRGFVEHERPGLVIIDTLWRATRRQLRREEEANALLDPIITLAQDTETAIVGLMHLSKDGETLGRRLEGLARAVMKLTRPDPEGQPDRRRLWVIGNFKEPPPLGVTLKAGGCAFDFDPPTDASPNRGGRPPEKLDKAVAFIEAELAKGDRKGVEIIHAWELADGAKGTIFNARDAMVKDGRLVVDTTSKPQVWRLAPVNNGQQPGS